MHFKPPAISARRLERTLCAALAWLADLAELAEAFAGLASMPREAQRLAHGVVDYFERIICAVAILRAAAHVRFLPRHRRAPLARRGGLVRAILGSALRRRLRHRSLRTRIQALRLGAVGLAERIAKRLPRGLTRRRPILPKPSSASPALGNMPATATEIADSS